MPRFILLASAGASTSYISFNPATYSPWYAGTSNRPTFTPSAWPAAVVPCRPRLSPVNTISWSVDRTVRPL